METNRGTLAPRDVFRILFRHKWKFTFVFTAIMVLVVVGLVVCPRTYVSESKLFVRMGRESVGLDPSATVGATIAIQDSRESEIRSVIDVLDSRVIRERVVAALGAGPILHQSEDKPASEVNEAGFKVRAWVKAALGTFMPTDEVSDDERAIRVLEDSVDVEAGKKSNVVTIRCKAGAPRLSQRIVEVFVDAYRNEHRAVNANESYAFFQKQAGKLREELDEATRELGEAKNELGLTTIAGQRELFESQITNLTKEQSDNASSISASNAKLTALRSKLDPADGDFIPSGTGLTQSSIDQMRDTLYKLQIQEREMGSKYHDSHPALIAIHQQVREVEKILAKQELSIELANAASLEARRTAIETSITANADRLKRLNQNEVSIMQLERRVELLRTSFQSYSEKAEQSRVARALDEEQLTNLKVVQPATYVAKAVSPKVAIVLPLGVFVAAFGGLAVALLFEFFDHSFQTPEQIESQLRVPVLMAIPYWKQRGVSLN